MQLRERHSIKRAMLFGLVMLALALAISGGCRGHGGYVYNDQVFNDIVGSNGCFKSFRVWSPRGAWRGW